MRLIPLVAIAARVITAQKPPTTDEINRAYCEMVWRDCVEGDENSACHSNETRWPWYSRIAPGSFLITHDVVEGREHLNFSLFHDLDAFDSSDIADEIIEVLEKEEMPLLPYLMLHPDASLSAGETQVLMDWAETLYPN